jgi:hypothetical protein
MEIRDQRSTGRRTGCSTGFRGRLACLSIRGVVMIPSLAAGKTSSHTLDQASDRPGSSRIAYQGQRAVVAECRVFRIASLRRSVLLVSYLTKLCSIEARCRHRNNTSASISGVARVNWGRHHLNSPLNVTFSAAEQQVLYSREIASLIHWNSNRLSLEQPSYLISQRWSEVKCWKFGA